MMRENKFAFLVDKESDPQSDVEPEVPPQPETQEVPPVRSKKKPRSAPKESIVPSPEPEQLVAQPKKMGRPPRGKRSNPDYEQITAYIRKETHLNIKASLLRDATGRDFSELIQDLLDEYLSTQKSKNSKV